MSRDNDRGRLKYLRNLATSQQLTREVQHQLRLLQENYQYLDEDQRAKANESLVWTSEQIQGLVADAEGFEDRNYNHLTATRNLRGDLLKAIAAISGAIGIALLLLGGILFNNSNWELASNLALNLGTEITGIAITLAVIELTFMKIGEAESSATEMFKEMSRTHAELLETLNMVVNTQELIVRKQPDQSSDNHMS
jgi:hypothetical protein